MKKPTNTKATGTSPPPSGSREYVPTGSRPVHRTSQLATNVGRGVALRPGNDGINQTEALTDDRAAKERPIDAAGLSQRGESDLGSVADRSEPLRSNRRRSRGSWPVPPRPSTRGQRVTSSMGSDAGLDHTERSSSMPIPC